MKTIDKIIIGVSDIAFPFGTISAICFGAILFIRKPVPGIEAGVVAIVASVISLIILTVFLAARFLKITCPHCSTKFRRENIIVITGEWPACPKCEKFILY